MPQRNGQNPIKLGKNFGQGAGNFNDPANSPGKTNNPGAFCPACKAGVPPKPGFRFSALKCPKCGAAMAKK